MIPGSSTEEQRAAEVRGYLLHGEILQHAVSYYIYGGLFFPQPCSQVPVSTHGTWEIKWEENMAEVQLVEDADRAM